MFDAMSQLLDWFAQTFDEQKEKSKYWNQSYLDLDHTLSNLRCRKRIDQQDESEIRDNIIDIEQAAQELAYMRGISDGAKLMNKLLDMDFPEQFMELMDDLIVAKQES